MTLRSCGRDTVPITGPRSRALAAPQAIGKLSSPPGAGCEVMRIWSTRLERVIATDPETATARLSRRAWSNQRRLQLSGHYNQIWPGYNGDSRPAGRPPRPLTLFGAAAVVWMKRWAGSRRVHPRRLLVARDQARCLSRCRVSRTAELL